MRTTISLALLLCALGASSGRALAQDTAAPAAGGGWSDTTGTIGLGAEVSLVGLSGFSVRYGLSESIGFGALVGMGIDTANDTTIFGVAVSATVRLHGWDDGLMAFYGEVDVASLTSETSSGGPMPIVVESNLTVFGFGAGIHGEWFPAEFLSFHMQTGIRVAYASGESGNADVSGFQLAGGGELLGTAGFTVWLI